MIGRRVLQCQTEVRSQAQGVLDPPGHPPLGIDPLEVTDEQRAEVHTRCQSRTPESVGVERLATLLGELIEAMLRQQAVQPFIKHVTRRLRQCLRHHEQPLLTLLLPPSHRHRNHLREFLINHRDDSLAPFSFPSTVSSDFHHGLLGRRFCHRSKFFDVSKNFKRARILVCEVERAGYRGINVICGLCW